MNMPAYQRLLADALNNPSEPNEVQLFQIKYVLKGLIKDVEYDGQGYAVCPYCDGISHKLSTFTHKPECIALVVEEWFE